MIHQQVNVVLKFIHNAQASLLSEKHAAEEAKKACMDAEARNAELVNKLGDAEQKIDQLQDSVQRSVWNF